MKELIFVAIVLFWMSIGINAIFNCKNRRGKIQLVIFILSTLLLPFLAKFCGLLE